MYGTNRNGFVVMVGGPLSNGVVSSGNNWLADSFCVGVVVTFVLRWEYEP